MDALHLIPVFLLNSKQKLVFIQMPFFICPLNIGYFSFDTDTFAHVCRLLRDRELYLDMKS